MGLTLTNLTKKSLSTSPIFPNRFVIEICEKVHTHYKNVRLVNTLPDWVNMAEGFKDALERWKKRGCPGTGKNVHVELCRKKIANESDNKDILINLNRNLYLVNEGRIFSEGAHFSEPTYIHLKVGDVRLELSLKQFEELSDAVIEAKERIKSSDISPLLQTA